MKENQNDPNLINNFLFVIKNTVLIIFLISVILFLGYNSLNYFNNNLIFIYEKAYYYIIGINVFLFLCWIVIATVHEKTEKKYEQTRKNLLIAFAIFITPVAFSILALPIGYLAYKDRYLTCHTYYNENGFQNEKCIREEP